MSEDLKFENVLSFSEMLDFLASSEKEIMEIIPKEMMKTHIVKFYKDIEDRVKISEDKEIKENYETKKFMLESMNHLEMVLEFKHILATIIRSNCTPFFD